MENSRAHSRDHSRSFHAASLAGTHQQLQNRSKLLGRCYFSHRIQKLHCASRIWLSGNDRLRPSDPKAVAGRFIRSTRAVAKKYESRTREPAFVLESRVSAPLQSPEQEECGCSPLAYTKKPFQVATTRVRLQKLSTARSCPPNHF